MPNSAQLELILTVCTWKLHQTNPSFLLPERNMGLDIFQECQMVKITPLKLYHEFGLHHLANYKYLQFRERTRKWDIRHTRKASSILVDLLDRLK